MSVCLITGAGGLVGSTAVEYFAQQGMTVVGIDNNMRKEFFSEEAETSWRIIQLRQRHREQFVLSAIDIRHRDNVNSLFEQYGENVELIIHAAAQPSHDWAASNPIVDFDVNARATLLLLEAARKHCPTAPFIFCSTNKVYGDQPNGIPMDEGSLRYNPSAGTRYVYGVDEQMDIDQSMHSLFGASKLAADILVQEYGRYFGMPTVCFRAGCLTGPAHSAVTQHGFLSYLMNCTVRGEPYVVYGYEGKQVRDNLHSSDLVRAFDAYVQKPKPAAVYNIGGGRRNSCSVLEAIDLCQDTTGKVLNWTYQSTPRKGDHRWYVTNSLLFEQDYGWKVQIGLSQIMEELYEAAIDRYPTPSEAAYE